ncbi:MAG: radical SAM superfamily enzyme YgiQ (UPF0313 family) [Flavobacterium sp.]
MQKSYVLKDVLLLTPPFTQLNTPYPATAYIKGFLNTKQIDSFQMDLGIEVILKLFSKAGLRSVFKNASIEICSENSHRIFSLQNSYISTIDSVILFLQGQNATLARQILQDNFLPKASRFSSLDDLEYAFGTMGLQDKAKHLATLYLEDISDFIVDCLDANFGFSRYAESLGRSANTFDVLYAELQKNWTYIDYLTIEIFKQKIVEINPKVVLISVPFPGNLYSAFRIGQFIKSNYPKIKIAMGGGFPNTELREIKDSRVFEFIDFITLDDGELPVELLLEAILNKKDFANPEFKRTFSLQNNKVVYTNNSLKPDYKQKDIGTPDYQDLLLDKYVSVIEIANPMHSLWSDGRWNKLTMAHGCYWGKCTFCDISLDYIKLYEPIAASILVDRMQEMIAQTGETGFHFVDEAAPPALMREVALEILKRNLTVSWWTNIRFEKSFTADLCILLQASGCIAVSGGLEVASDRLLQLIKKGVTVQQVAVVTKNFTEAGIMVHAYLMYGYPTQTIQETIDSLEMVRQLFKTGIIQSGFWHQFAMTAHSPVGMFPEEFGVIPAKQEITFANNDVAFYDKTEIDHSKFSFGLKKSLFNYMHSVSFDFSLQEWFDFKIPRTTISPNYIEDSITDNSSNFQTKSNAVLLFLGSKPIITDFTKSKKGTTWEMQSLTFHFKTETISLSLEKEKSIWLQNLLYKIEVTESKKTTFSAAKIDFEERFEDFELFWFSKQMQSIKNYLLSV